MRLKYRAQVYTPHTGRDREFNVEVEADSFTAGIRKAVIEAAKLTGVGEELHVVEFQQVLAS